MIRLRIQAQFGAFRDFSASTYRTTMPCAPPSGLYGIVCGLTGVETRLYDHEDCLTDMKDPKDLPVMNMAFGVVKIPSVQSAYQQLHNYPVSNNKANRELLQRAFGSKYNIQPIRREFLSGIDIVVCIKFPEGSSLSDDVVRDAVTGRLSGQYGIPFLGDNQFMIDSVDEDLDTPVRWYRKATREDNARDAVARARLVVWANRRSPMSDSITASYILDKTASDKSPSDDQHQYWTLLPPADLVIAAPRSRMAAEDLESSTDDLMAAAQPKNTRKPSRSRGKALPETSAGA